MFSLLRIDDRLTLIRLESRLSRAVGYGNYVPLVEATLVDSGFARGGRALLSALGARRVEQVVNTHNHEDHIGNNALLARRLGARILAPPSSLTVLARPRAAPYRVYQRVLWGIPQGWPGEAVGEEVRTGELRLRVIPTPGHCHDHVAYFEPRRRWLFSGDLFLGVKVRVARPFENAADLLSSLARVIELAPRALFCYHRGPVPDPVAALEAKARFLGELRAAALRLRDQGLDERRMARRLLGPPSLAQGLLTGGDYTRIRLVRSLLKPPGTGYRPPG